MAGLQIQDERFCSRGAATLSGEKGLALLTTIIDINNITDIK
jgi:hypothetical protein